jgi:hypothetical protein
MAAPENFVLAKVRSKSGIFSLKFLFSALSHAHFSLDEWKTSNYDWQNVAVII